MDPGEELTLRPCLPEEGEFLYQVYASTREEELARVPWNDAEKDAFLRMQFHAQHTHYHTHYADADYQIILRSGVPIGRIYVHRAADEISLMDIALLPAWRGCGIGTRLIRAVLDEADRAGTLTSLYVELSNPAMRLYSRLGFTRIKEEGLYWRMERQPPEVAAAGS
jgi:ribosomal protein S18 acetylase RimI-like enzyme